MKNCSRYIAFLCLILALSNLANGQALKHRILTADSSKQRIAILDEQGEVEWEHKIGPLHDLHMLENGNVLFQEDWTSIVEVDPRSHKVVWRYESQSSDPKQKIEVHSFQRLDNGHTIIAESGVSRIIEVDQDGKIVHQIKLQVSQPHPHRDTRLVRKLPNGNFLVCQESDALVREYATDGGIVWEYAIPLFGQQPKPGHGTEAFGNQCFSALRLENGNTLIATGNGHSVIEVTADKEIVWRVQQHDIPGITLAWVTTLQQLPNGNLVIGNCHAGPDNPQIVEIDREKKVVWSFYDFERFGNALTNTQILSSNGKPVRAVLGRDR